VKTTALDELGAIESNFNAPAWMPYLSRFLLRRENFTTWVESSYCYRLTPSLRQTLRIVQDIARDTDQDTGAQREIHWVLHGLNQFAEALEELLAKHHETLRSNPTRLWGKDIRAARDPIFWPMRSKLLEPTKVELAPNKVQGVQWLGAVGSGPVQQYSDITAGYMGMGP
jgi:hypothetical protein